VRLVYIADRNQPWTQNVHFSSRFAYVPCQWAGLIQAQGCSSERVDEPLGLERVLCGIAP